MFLENHIFEKRFEFGKLEKRRNKLSQTGANSARDPNSSLWLMISACAMSAWAWSKSQIPKCVKKIIIKKVYVSLYSRIYSICIVYSMYFKYNVYVLYILVHDTH